MQMSHLLGNEIFWFIQSVKAKPHFQCIGLTQPDFLFLHWQTSSWCYFLVPALLCFQASCADAKMAAEKWQTTDWSMPEATILRRCRSFCQTADEEHKQCCMAHSYPLTDTILNRKLKLGNLISSFNGFPHLYLLELPCASCKKV